MRLEIGGVGRLTKGPERALVERYVERARALGRTIGIRDVTVFDCPEGRAAAAAARRRDEAERLLSRVAPAAAVIVLDEAGEPLGSMALAERLRRWYEGGVATAVFLVGGPDGHGEAALHRADFMWSLGPQTMPHLLVRAVVAEQVYRAITILAHHPYHRE